MQPILDGAFVVCLLMTQAIWQFTCAQGANPNTILRDTTALLEGEIRCYCNDATCVSTGYMCKSKIGRCFSQLAYEGDMSSSSVHGCVDSLPPQDKSVCQGEGDIMKTRTGQSQWPILMCCKDDMCNYMDTMDINIYVNTNNNGSYLKEDSNQRRVPVFTRDHSIEDSFSAGDLWFKAAVIAVPIAGGFILILLVLLAVRMLRNDNRRHRQLMQMRQHRSLTKAQLYVADHFYQEKKGEKDSNSDSNNDKNQIYKDINIKIDIDGSPYEKLTEKLDKETLKSGTCNSVIVWGKKDDSKGSTFV